MKLTYLLVWTLWTAFVVSAQLDDPSSPFFTAFYEWIWSILCFILRLDCALEDSFDSTVIVDIYRTYQEINGTKMYSISDTAAQTQIDGLGYWFKDKVTFQLGEIKDYRPEFHVIPNGTYPCDAIRDDWRSGDVFNSRRISAIYVREIRDGPIAGCVPRVDIPAGIDIAPPVLIMHNTNSLYGFQSSVLSIILAHEVCLRNVHGDVMFVF